ncbi:DEAD/SNF2 helicase [uncultured virus]|nr:DEAD/SNF2 helicase [uncultured virus]
MNSETEKSQMQGVMSTEASINQSAIPIPKPLSVTISLLTQSPAILPVLKQSPVVIPIQSPAVIPVLKGSPVVIPFPKESPPIVPTPIDKIIIPTIPHRVPAVIQVIPDLKTIPAAASSPQTRAIPLKFNIIPNGVFPGVIPKTITLNPVTNKGLTLKVLGPNYEMRANFHPQQISLKFNVIAMGMARMSPYQREIIQECIEKENGGLSLPMGTGKTIISILVSLMQCRNYPGSRVLVIVSKSLITTWEEEFAKFFGNNISFEILHNEYIKNMAAWVPTAEIVITTPEVISKVYTKYEVGGHFSYTERPEAFAPEIRYYRTPDNPYLNYPCSEGCLYSVKWGAVIIDEAHNYFNPTSARCLAMASLSAHHRWLLSGTLLAEPKPDKLLGYHLMLNYANFPRNLPGFKTHITSDNYPGIADTMVIREENVDFVPPTINKRIISHPLSETEALIYTNVKAILNILRERLKEFKRNGDKVNTKKFSSYIMGMISHMRQCLVCPLIPITTVAIDVADFEQRSDLSEMFMNHINNMGIDAWLNDVNSLYSSRIRSVCETVNQHPKERIIIFSCYRTVLDVFALYLPKDRQVFTISGNDKIQNRIKIIEDYRASHNGILLLTYEIGANGLNLQCSSTAILVDFWWNAGKSSQAIARLLRPGQTANMVNLYYFTANSGIENALFKLQTAKIAMGEEILIGKMTTNTEKIKVDDIIRLIDIEDNITVLDGLIA